ncbi:hypothetical protein J4207_04470 [Candidatus Woesearchaeota archaeon]|nr:hypothetical protein [Candidatus Woesearchaeota archaeon]HLC80709.1 hypothetical protein [Candidatus Nanoarchaeia archaeon]
MKNSVTFKKDSYWQARGKYSRRLNIRCKKCNHLICTYQKDGPGNLRRLYFDRIFSSKSLVDLQDKNLKKVSDLRCSNCKEILGIPYIYVKEKRKAFRLFQDAIIKKVIKISHFG